MIRILIILAFTTFAIQTFAQNSPTVWTLRRCINFAIQNNVKLKQIEHAKNSQEVILKTTRTGWLPTVSASIGQNMDFGRSPSKDGTIKDQSSLNSNFYLQTSMPLFEGLRIKNEIKAQEWNVISSIQNLFKAQDDITVSVFTYYMQALFKREIEKIAREQVALCMNQLKRTEILVENGSIARSQLYDMEAQLAKDETTLVNAQNDASLALLDLALIMNLDVDENEFDIEVPNLENIESEYRLTSKTMCI